MAVAAVPAREPRRAIAAARAQPPAGSTFHRDLPGLELLMDHDWLANRRSIVIHGPSWALRFLARCQSSPARDCRTGAALPALA